MNDLKVSRESDEPEIVDSEKELVRINEQISPKAGFVDSEKALEAVKKLQKHLENTRHLHNGKISDLSLSDIIGIFNPDDREPKTAADGYVRKTDAISAICSAFDWYEINFGIHRNDIETLKRNMVESIKELPERRLAEDENA